LLLTPLLNKKTHKAKAVNLLAALAFLLAATTLSTGLFITVIFIKFKEIVTVKNRQ